MVILLLGVLLMSHNSYARSMYAAAHFYPEIHYELSAYVDKALSGENKKISGIVAVVAPHAGYVFSGAIAARAFAPINSSYDLVIIMSTGHSAAVRGAALLVNDDYETPLGKVETDRALAQKLISEEPLFEDNASAHQLEHGIEVELPFLQRKLKKPFKLLAMTLNNANDIAIKKMASALALAVKGRKVLIVISTDLSHYTDSINAKYSDEAFAESIKSMDYAFIKQTSALLSSKKIKGLQTIACGEKALMLGMETAKILGAKSFKLGEVSNSYLQYPQGGSKDRVVGYMNGWFLTSGKPAVNKLRNKDKKILLKEARTSIQNAFSSEKNSIIKNPKLNLPAAVFVTLNLNGKLRGCMGTMQPNMLMSDAVRTMAYAAAFNDSRFPPLTLPELEKASIEISILSSMKKVSEAEIENNVHGVLIKKADKSGVFLPQVWKQIPSKEKFLNELCTKKAGLPNGCWKMKDTEIYTFTVDSFEEGERTVKNKKSVKTSGK